MAVAKYSGSKSARRYTGGRSGRAGRTSYTPPRTTYRPPPQGSTAVSVTDNLATRGTYGPGKVTPGFSPTAAGQPRRWSFTGGAVSRGGRQTWEDYDVERSRAMMRNEAATANPVGYNAMRAYGDAMNAAYSRNLPLGTYTTARMGIPSYYQPEGSLTGTYVKPIVPTGTTGFLTQLEKGGPLETWQEKVGRWLTTNYGPEIAPAGQLAYEPYQEPYYDYGGYGGYGGGGGGGDYKPPQNYRAQFGGRVSGAYQGPAQQPTIRATSADLRRPFAIQSNPARWMQLLTTWRV